MSRQMTLEEQPRLKYPNSFLFGMASGFSIQYALRRYTVEPLAARPLSYIKFALMGGVMMWYWDYWRRVAMENVLESEDRYRYYQQMQSLNHHMRVGDENEINNLTEYLASSTTRM